LEFLGECKLVYESYEAMSVEASARYRAESDSERDVPRGDD